MEKKGGRAQANNKGKKERKREDSATARRLEIQRKEQSPAGRQREKGEDSARQMHAPQKPVCAGPAPPRDPLRGAPGGPFGLEGAGEAEPGATWALCTGSVFNNKAQGVRHSRVPGLMAAGEMSKEGL